MIFMQIPRAGGQNFYFDLNMPTNPTLSYLDFLGHNEHKRNRANDPPGLDFVVLIVVRCVLRDHASDSLFGPQP